MIRKIFIYNAQGTDPHENLAMEKTLMDALAPGEAMLYLWQNLNTVVIGKNQNAWLECRTSLLDESLPGACPVVVPSITTLVI